MTAAERAHEAAVAKILHDQRDTVARIELERGLESIRNISMEQAAPKFGVAWCMEARTPAAAVARLAGLAVAMGVVPSSVAASRWRLKVRTVQHTAQEARAWLGL